MPKKSKDENKQLNLKLKESPFNFLVKFKESIELSRAKWNIKRYTKSTWVWFTIVISISLIVTQLYTIQEEFSNLPKKFPLFQIYVDSNKTLTETVYIYLIPAISVFIIVIGIIFSNKYYNKERELANTLLLSMFLSVLVITIALIRLINLY
jgi:membrane glycosyltransferase